MNTSIFNIIAPIFILILIGWAYAAHQKTNLSSMNQAAIDIFAPILIFYALASRPIVWQEHIQLMVAVLVVVAGSGILAYVVAKIFQIDPRSFLPPMMFNNGAYIGIPVATMAFGMEVLPLAAIMFVVANTVQFTFGIKLVHPHAKTHHILFSSTLIATVLGMTYRMQEIVTLPFAFMKTGEMVTTMTITYMLFSLGVRMSETKIHHLKQGIIAAITCPLVSIVTVWLIDQSYPLSDLHRKLLWLYAFYPPAVINFMIAERFKHDPQTVASMVFAGNFFGIVFVPFGLWLVKHLPSL